MSETEPGPNDKARILREEIDLKKRFRADRERAGLRYVVVGLIGLILAAVVYRYHSRYFPGPIFAASALACLLVALGGVFLMSGASIDTEIRALESEFDLAVAEGITPERRAEKLFKHHQVEVQKYYDQTLYHSKWIFGVGLFCIFVGFGIVAVAFWLVAKPQGQADFREKVLVSALGAVGAILSNFIAAIYLRMFSEILTSVTAFHNRLVETHNLYFANFLVTKVSEGNRDGVVLEIARNLTKMGNSDAAKADSGK